MMRCLLFGAVVVASMFGVVALIVTGVLYALRYTAYELIVFAGLLDAYYGNSFEVPVYTLGTIGLLVCVELVKPYLTLYNQ